MNIQIIQKALKIQTLPLVFKKKRGSWAAYLPEKIDQNGAPVGISKVAVCDFGNQTLRRLRFTVASRYMAQVFEDSMVCHINLRWAMKLPNWQGRFGALNELAHAMNHAGLLN
jgi:hypothetical protein